MGIFERFRKEPKKPETPSVDDKFKSEDAERMRLMETRREEAEKKNIEQAQRDLKELPGEIAALETQIRQLRDGATNMRDLGYDEQLKPGGNKGAYEQEAVVKDLGVKVKEQEKLNLEVKLDTAKRLLESRGLLEKK